MNDDIDVWKIEEAREIADCRVFKVTELRSVSERGKRGTFFRLENSDWVNVIAMTPDREIVMIEQYRHGASEITLEIPGGMVDDGESPAEAAARELIEETGYAAAEVVMIGRSRPNPALHANWVYHYAAMDARLMADASFDEHESVRTRLVGASDVRSMIASGEISHSLVVAAFYFLGLLETESK